MCGKCSSARSVQRCSVGRRDVEVKVAAGAGRSRSARARGTATQQHRKQRGHQCRAIRAPAPRRGPSLGRIRPRVALERLRRRCVGIPTRDAAAAKFIILRRRAPNERNQSMDEYRPASVPAPSAPLRRRRACAAAPSALVRDRCDPDPNGWSSGPTGLWFLAELEQLRVSPKARRGDAAVPDRLELVGLLLLMPARRSPARRSRRCS